MSQSIEVFKSCIVEPIHTVIDVGAQTKTEWLLEAFKDSHHYLFEPVALYHKWLSDNYHQRDVSHEVIPVALSDIDGILYQHLISSDLSGKVTHSQLLEQPNPERFGAKLCSIVETRCCTLDSYFEGAEIKGPYLVKIDVDGLEDRIIDGGGRVLKSSSAVIVEAPLNMMLQRAGRIQELGFKLFDIVGNGYFCDQLSQVDLFFISNALAEKNINFSPWKKHGKIVWDKWQQY